jgi:hypothetical protein
MVRGHLPLRDHPRGAWLGLVAVLILATLALLVACASRAPAEPAAQTIQPTSYLPPVERPPYSRISFVSDRDERSGIYVMYADGSHQTNLTKNLADDTDPVWSPR